MNLGISIKKIRKARCLTQINFCKTVGITQSYLSQIETGKKTPSIYLLKKISNSLNTPISVLFWVTLTEQDIPKKKRDVFKLLKPSVDDLVDLIIK